MKPKAKAFLFAIGTLFVIPIIFMVIGFIVANFLGPLLLFVLASILVWMFYLMWLEYFENRERFKIKKFE